MSQSNQNSHQTVISADKSSGSVAAQTNQKGNNHNANLAHKNAVGSILAQRN